MISTSLKDAASRTQTTTIKAPRLLAPEFPPQAPSSREVSFTDAGTTALDTCPLALPTRRGSVTIPHTSAALTEYSLIVGEQASVTFVSHSAAPTASLV